MGEKTDRINNLLREISEERLKLVRNQIHIDAVKKICTENSGLKSTLKSKINKIIEKHELDKLIYVSTGSTSTSETFTLLDVKGQNEELNYDEGKELEDIFKLQLLKEHTLTVNKQNLIEKMNLQLKTNFNQIDPINPEVVELKTQLDEAYQLYTKNLMETTQLLEKMVDIRQNDAANVTKNKADDLLTQAQILELKLKLTKQKLKSCIFNDSDFTMRAYAHIQTDMAKETKMLNEEITKLTKELSALKNMESNPEMYQLFKKYLDVKKSLDALTKVLEA